MADKRRTSRSNQAEPRAKAAAGRSASKSTVRAKREAAGKGTSEPTRIDRAGRGQTPRPTRQGAAGGRRRREASPGRPEAGVDTLRIKLVRSPIGTMQRHKDTVRTLGLRRLNQVVERPDSPQLRGMIFAVKHLVQVVE
jgi:large subunit ribosomal protein L30